MLCFAKLGVGRPHNFEWMIFLISNFPVNSWYIPNPTAKSVLSCWGKNLFNKMVNNWFQTTVACDGQCPCIQCDCREEEKPVCGEDNVTYNNEVRFLTLIAYFYVGCHMWQGGACGYWLALNLTRIFSDYRSAYQYSKQVLNAEHVKKLGYLAKPNLESINLWSLTICPQHFYLRQGRCSCPFILLNFLWHFQKRPKHPKQTWLYTQFGPQFQIWGQIWPPRLFGGCSGLRGHQKAHTL